MRCSSSFYALECVSLVCVCACKWLRHGTSAYLFSNCPFYALKCVWVCRICMSCLIAKFNSNINVHVRVTCVRGVPLLPNITTKALSLLPNALSAFRIYSCEPRTHATDVFCCIVTFPLFPTILSSMSIIRTHSAASHREVGWLRHNAHETKT